ncbi:hypothetical protein ACFRAQ_07635 [Nocardia sp. NPDC056611]|uniref:hypothetical protein n=1 Tax=Nocardia sp. NPDC056611 TaxID=3345877 RepID=UPI003670BCE6
MRTNSAFDSLIIGAAANLDPLFIEELGTNIIEETVELEGTGLRPRIPGIGVQRRLSMAGPAG